METSSDRGATRLGELIPVGGGDPIPLLKERLLVGRRESCDIVLRFGNISAHHCELMLEQGYWFVKDLNSRNGTRLNGYRITKKRMDPGDKLTIAHHEYKASYSPADLGAEGPPPDVDVMDEIMSKSLLEGAGLDRKKRQEADGRIGAKQPASPAVPEPGAEATDADIEAEPEPSAGDNAEPEEDTEASQNQFPDS